MRTIRKLTEGKNKIVSIFTEEIAHPSRPETILCSWSSSEADLADKKATQTSLLLTGRLRLDLDQVSLVQSDAAMRIPDAVCFSSSHTPIQWSLNELERYPGTVMRKSSRRWAGSPFYFKGLRSQISAAEHPQDCFTANILDGMR